MMSGGSTMGWRWFTLVALVLPLFSGVLSAQLLFERNPRQDPYQKLFRDALPGQAAGSRRDDERLKALPSPLVRRDARPGAPYVVCGTLIVPADPRVDPKIRVGPPDAQVDHTMRIIEPPICRAPEPR
jgi:hypothetical protein